MNKPEIEKLIFVYNANSGYFNIVADIGHKIFSPDTYPCSLCNITYGIFKIKPEWQNFIQSINLPLEFLHKDEFVYQYPDLKSIQLPAILSKQFGKPLKCIMSHTELNKLSDIKNLKALIISKLSDF